MKRNCTPRKHSPARALAAAVALAIGMAGAAHATTRDARHASPAPVAAQLLPGSGAAAAQSTVRAAAAPAVPARKIDWLNPATWPVLPVPLTAVDPLSGLTLGIIPTVLHTNSAGEINRIIAPDIDYNSNFGMGVDARIFDYPSPNSEWYVEGGVSQRIQSWFNAKLKEGRLRESPWSWSVQLEYSRDGTPRFYGIGNNSLRINQTVYTDQQMFARTTLGWNINHTWQLAYTFMARKVTILASHLPGIPSITSRFRNILGLGVTHELLQRVALVYDTRNNIVIPTRGAYVIVYGGVASRNVDLDSSLFTEAGVDARFYWAATPSLTVATHFDLRYEPTVHHVPFWALSSLGGDHDSIGGSQPLRGYGTSRFYDRNAFDFNLELRQTVLEFAAFSTHIALQATPFFDAGRVFRGYGQWPISHLHTVLGIGFRAIAAPSVVGYVDIGEGLGRSSQGLAVFTGIGYPF
jgi:hypothetical protein